METQEDTLKQHVLYKDNPSKENWSDFLNACMTARTSTEQFNILREYFETTSKERATELCTYIAKAQTDYLCEQNFNLTTPRIDYDKSDCLHKFNRCLRTTTDILRILLKPHYNSDEVDKIIEGIQSNFSGFEVIYNLNGVTVGCFSMFLYEFGEGGNPDTTPSGTYVCKLREKIAVNDIAVEKLRVASVSYPKARFVHATEALGYK
jgi:hypothetical protein